MSICSFLKTKNIEFSLKRYGIDAMNFMALGLFCSLIVGLILKSIGIWTDTLWLVYVGQQAQNAMGAAIGIGVAYALQAPPLVLFSSTVTGLAGAALGGPAGCFVAVALGAETGKCINKSTAVDIIVTPAVTIGTGIAAAQLLGGTIAKIMLSIGAFMMWTVELQPVIMGAIIAVVMGILLTLPISSAAIAIAIALSGLAAGAATVGCCTQMIGFAVMSYRENKVAGLLSQGLGTSMLQMPNIIRNPKIVLPAVLVSAVLGALSTTVFQMRNIPEGAGMGTSGLVGQIGTVTAMGNTVSVWFSIMLLHFVLPALLTYGLSIWFRRKGWIKEGDLKLDL